MDTGLLILRLGLAVLLFGHVAQKMFGWFGGLGSSGTAPVGQLGPTSKAVDGAARLDDRDRRRGLGGVGRVEYSRRHHGHRSHDRRVAITAGNGFWARKGGCELPLVYATIGAVLLLTGPVASRSTTLPGYQRSPGPVQR